MAKTLSQFENIKRIHRSGAYRNHAKEVAEHEASRSKSKAIEKAKGGHKQGEREIASKKAGHYVQGHKNYGDVYEA